MALEIKIHYEEGATHIKKIDKGDWIDLYSNETVKIYEGDSAIISLGIACQLPKGYEAHIAPRSSTFKTWGVVATNSFGIIDESYCGNNDIWKMLVQCTDGKQKDFAGRFSIIKKGDKICQFRIVEKMPEVVLTEVDDLGNEDRRGIGSTGTI